MKLVKPSGEERDVPRGVVGGAEISQGTTGATNIYMGIFRVPAGSRGRPHYHDNCESALYMLSGSIEIQFGDQLEERVVVEPGDMLYVPPRQTHVVVNRLTQPLLSGTPGQATITYRSGNPRRESTYPDSEQTALSRHLLQPAPSVPPRLAYSQSHQPARFPDHPHPPTDA